MDKKQVKELLEAFANDFMDRLNPFWRSEMITAVMVFVVSLAFVIYGIWVLLLR